MGDMVNGGTVSPGNSPGRLTIAGNYRQTPDALLQLELAGNEAGTEYDVLQGDAAMLDGGLEVSLLNAFRPRAGDVFHVLDFRRLHGRFQQLDLPNLPGLSWDTSELYIAGTLMVVPEPKETLYLVFAAIALSMQHSLRRKRPRQGFSHAH
jgi:hypothetical protein